MIRKQFRTTVALLTLLAFALTPAVNADFTIMDENALATIDPTSVAGMHKYEVNGVDHLVRQWFWISIDGLAPIPINALGGLVTTPLATDSIRFDYTDGTISVRLTLTIAGDGSGALNSDLNESIKVKNESGVDHDIKFYEYVDFNLGGTAMDDSVVIDPTPPGTGAVQVDSPGGAAVSENVVGPAPDHWEAGIGPGGGPGTLDGSFNLPFAAGPVGPGNLFWAFQWDRTLAGGATLLVSKDKFLIPAPGGALLGMMGMGMVGLVRRRFV